MIITALASYYERLLREHPDRVARPGWTTCKVKYQLVISEDGAPIKLIPAAEKGGTPRIVPAQEGKTCNVRAYFLCNTPAYYFGFDKTAEKTERSVKCFEASKALHYELLRDVDSPLARAILAYFDTFNPGDFTDAQFCGSEFRDVCASGNITFTVLTNDGVLLNAEEDALVAHAWDDVTKEPDSPDNDMVCLATGEKTAPAVLHPDIKGVSTSVAKLVSFNEQAFESYGHVHKKKKRGAFEEGQGRNAPIGEKTAQAYGLALNYLLSNRSHHLVLGDTTIVFWAEHADGGNADLFSALLSGRGSTTASDGIAADKNLEAILKSFRAGRPVDIDDVDFATTFYVLGLAPNKGRLAVRFFLRDEFGDMLGNLDEHYRRIEVVRGGGDRFVLRPYWLLQAVENPKKDPAASMELVAPLVRAILTGGRYPEALYSNTMLRIKATRKVTYAQAAIIKGYLIRNCGRSEEEVTVELNEGRNSVAYDLGRAFAYLGQIQEAANGKDTLTGRYLDSACTRPAVVFPTLLKLSTSHLQKLSKDKPGLAISLEKGLSAVLSEEKVASFPKHLSLPEQGDFMLGYYHQKAKRYQKKSSESATNAADEAKEA